MEWEREAGRKGRILAAFEERDQPKNATEEDRVAPQKDIDHIDHSNIARTRANLKKENNLKGSINKIRARDRETASATKEGHRLFSSPSIRSRFQSDQRGSANSCAAHHVVSPHRMFLTRCVGFRFVPSWRGIIARAEQAGTSVSPFRHFVRRCPLACLGSGRGIRRVRGDGSAVLYFGNKVSLREAHVSTSIRPANLNCKR